MAGASNQEHQRSSEILVVDEVSTGEQQVQRGIEF